MFLCSRIVTRTKAPSKLLWQLHKCYSSSSNGSSRGFVGKEWGHVTPPHPDAPARTPVVGEIRVPKPVRPENEPLDAKRARLLWSVRKRGILECDLLLSTFVRKERLAEMDNTMLDQLDSLLEENDWDIYYWVTQAKKVPPEVEAFGFWADLVEHSKNKRKDILRMPDLD